MTQQKKNRRPSNPVMRKIDDAINYLEAQGKPVDVAEVTDNAIQRLAAKDVLGALEMLIRNPSRSRLIARGYRISDRDESDRNHWTDMGVDEFDEQIAVKVENERHIRRHLKADKAVRAYLDARSTDLGRPVTASEFEEKVVAIYDRHGISV